MQPNKEALEHLQKRVREATGPDRELDCQIYSVLEPILMTDVPPYTTDPEGLGACVALLREVLPGWFRTVHTLANGSMLVGLRPSHERNNGLKEAIHALETHALLLAIISAKLSLSKEKEALSQIGEG